MTPRVGGLGWKAASEGISTLGRTLAETALQRRNADQAEAEAEAQKQYRDQMIAVQQAQLAQGDRHFGKTLEQNYLTHGFLPGDDEPPARPSTLGGAIAREAIHGDPMLAAVGESGEGRSLVPGMRPRPLSETMGVDTDFGDTGPDDPRSYVPGAGEPLNFGQHVQRAALGIPVEPPAPPSSTRRGWRYDRSADPEAERLRLRQEYEDRQSEADRQNRVEVAKVGAGSRERVASMRGAGRGGGSAKVTVEDRAVARGVAAGLIRRHGNDLEAALAAARAMPDDPQKGLVIAAISDMAGAQVRHQVVTPPRPAKPTLADIAARLGTPR